MESSEPDSPQIALSLGRRRFLASVRCNAAMHSPGWNVHLRCTSTVAEQIPFPIDYTLADWPSVATKVACARFHHSLLEGALPRVHGFLAARIRRPSGEAPPLHLRLLALPRPSRRPFRFCWGSWWMLSSLCVNFKLCDIHCQDFETVALQLQESRKTSRKRWGSPFRRLPL